MKNRDIEKELLELANKEVKEKIEKERQQSEVKIKEDIKKVKIILDLIEKHIIYKVDDRYTSHAKFIPITKEIFFEDYANKGKYNDGIKLEEYDYESATYKFKNIKVNDIYYYHIGRTIPEFEKLIDEKLDKVKRYTFELNCIKDEVENLINQEKNIKKFIEDYNKLKSDLESQV